ncbi:FlgB family protein [Yoonia litorea]|uniref:Flagellar basal-body rod protein FlgB n=1 Tax=Yoonia litorea TaxID=1123755 RepID=A0A1I6MU92_9RHOB|nr:FlgB family protein [Yoonia litorea]SFS19201.1 flagellar basal-body rod protein FlgB [Yoonia litorea]
MYEKVALFQVASDMARHAGSRQAVVARNIANADTPGFQAHRLASFADIVGQGQSLSMKATRAGHMRLAPSSGPHGSLQLAGAASPNGNSVSLEDELMESVSVSREHSRAITVYRHSMTVLRTALGRG